MKDSSLPYMFASLKQGDGASLKEDDIACANLLFTKRADLHFARASRADRVPAGGQSPIHRMLETDRASRHHLLVLK